MLVRAMRVVVALGTVTTSLAMVAAQEAPDSDDNDSAPVLAASATHTVAEGQTVVATVIATDADGDTITYELTGGADQDDFAIGAASGELTFNTAPDFENPTDADGNNVYVVVVTATAGGQAVTQTVTVRVTNVDDNAPVFAEGSVNHTVAENFTTSAIVTTVTATDADGDDITIEPSSIIVYPITYTLTGADQSSFTIDPFARLRFNTVPDFENPGDADGNNVYVVVVTATSGTRTASQTVTVTVTNVDDNAPVFTSTAAHNVAEGQTTVTTVTATDDDGDTITYKLTGLERSSFTIDANTGELRFRTAPDFKNPGDTDGNNVYAVVVTATAGGQSTNQAVTVTVTNVNALVLAATAAHNVAEGQTAVTTVTATDDDGDTITYKLTGLDRLSFAIAPNTGELRFRTAPDFKNPEDADGNNVYVFVVTATVGTLTASQTVTVTVTNENAPVLAATAAHNVAEGQTAVATVIATDGDGDTITYTLTGGADRSSFTIDAASGVLAFKTAPDFENPTDAGGNNVYVVVVTATAGGEIASQTVTVTVTNENALVLAGTAAHSVVEGQTAVTTVIATDDDGDTITYELTGGADRSSFTIDAASGVLAFNTAPDFENPGDAGGNNVYVVVVTATAGGEIAFQTVTVTVTNVDDNAPVLASTAAHNVAEGQTVVATVIATDGDGDTITYELTGGADQGDFEIGAASGVLAFNTGPDFENPGSADNSNVYVVVVAATAGGQAVAQVVTVTVTNVDDNAPVLAATAAHTVAEGQTVVATVIATDGDGDTITYTLTGADQDDFEITDTGVLAFNTAPDFENPSDAGGNNVYVVVVAATSGTRTAFQTVTVTVTNVNDNAPVFATGSAAHNVAEGQTVVGTVIATDGDGDTITYELTGGADRSSFTIDAASGVLAFNTAPDFENPSDAGGNNVYVVVVTATAGGQAVTQVVTVTVTNVDDNAPVFAEGSAAHNVAEGQTVVAIVIATDGDGDTITYTLTGADQGDFEITDTGELAFNTAPDFENPGDAGGNNVYVVVVAATSGTRTAFQTVTVTVTNVNDNAPVFAEGSAAHNVAEGQTVVATVIATDGDGDTITYTLTGGADRSSFTIDAASGVLAFNTAPDFENPGSADNSNVYVVVVTATAGGQAVTQVVTVTVTNVDDNAPVFAEGSAAHNVAEGQTVVAIVIATDGDGDTITYTLTGADQDDFEITASGVLAFNTAPDFENPGDAGGNNVYVVVVAATAGTRTAFQTVTVTVTNVDDNAPVLAGTAAHSVVEGQTAVATVIAIDGDGDTITYTLTGGADRSSFTIDAASGVLAFRTAPDFENPGSADNSNIYVLEVTATAGGQAVTQVVTVTVTNVDDNAPVFAEGSAAHTVAEGQTAVATVIATDGDGDTITYTLTGADQDDFEITDTGVLAFNTAPDFENPSDAGGNNVYVVVVTATAGTRTAFQTVTVTVTNVNDNTPVLASTAAHNVAEGQTVVATVIATDGDGDTITYELTSGSDQGDFEITDTGELTFNTAPDFENPSDADGNNVYVVVVTATAGGEIASQTVTVTVTNENAPVFAAATATATYSVAEGQTVVATVIAIDDDGDTITYELTGGADRSSFTIDAASGVLAFNTAPDFENPTDAGGNNVYVVVVTATAGGEIASQTVTVTVTNVDDNAPVFAAGSAAHTVAEGQTVVATVIAIDGDGDTITYTLTGGADRPSFTIDADTGELTFNTAPDFENPGSADNSNIYVLEVTATAGGQAVTQVVTVTVTNVDDNAPVFAEGSAAHNVAEGQTVVATVIATDGDGDTITYTLTGVDQDDFEITDTGELAFNTAPDFENPTDAGGNNVYVVVVAATSGTRTAFQTVTVTVTNVNDNAPVLAGSAAHTVSEGQTAVATVIATDGDGDTITYTLTGADQDDFEITDTGELAFNTAPDFENPGSADNSNIYVLEVTATAGGQAVTQVVTVTVTNVDDNAPMFAAGSAAHAVAEGQTAVATVIASDGDGDTITYTLTGVDQDDFEITDTGVLAFNTAPDFENPTDAGGNNVYVVVVAATSGTRTAFQTVTVTVTNVDENAPVLAGSAAHNVAEGQTVVTTVIATDGDGDTITYELTGGADRSSFTIDAASGVLAFNTAPDFENPGDAGGNNVYVVVVTATAGGQAVTQAVTVTVTNVNENAPVLAGTAAHNVAEGQTVVTTVIATDGDGDTITYTLTGGADRSSFTIGAASGVLAFNTAPDFENPTDAGGNNVYVVVVTATAGGQAVTQAVTVTVTNVDDSAPVLASTAAHNVAEGQTVVATVIATDGDGDTITYTLTGVDQGDFEIGAASGVLAFNTAPDFENPGSADNSNIYVVVVTATAGTRTAFQTVTVTVTNLDDNAPVFAAGSAAHNVAEGQTAVATVIAIDGDGDTITYELTSGADQGDFEITDTGELAFNTAPDFENPGSADNSNVYVVVVTATAGGQAVTQVVTVTVTNVDDNAPVFAAGTAAHNVAEGQTVVATVIATDGDGDTITYTLTGADQDDFEIDAASGVLAFNTAPDFENPTDAGGNNVYVVVVAATAGTRTAFQTVTVTVTNVNDNAPVLAGSAAHTVSEGQTVVATVIAIDGDGDTITYTLTGVDQGDFEIGAASGVLAFRTAPDFENPGSADNSNIYVLEVTATAGGQAVTQVVTVTVTNVDDNAPVFAEGSAAHNVVEGQTAVATVIATDGDGDTITYTLTGADQDDFEITDTGVLAFNTAPDFENPSDAGGNNVYVVVVAATAGTRTAFQTVTVTVTNVNDNTPVFASTAAHNVAEGQTVVATVIATDGDGDTITYELTGGADQGDFEIGAASGVLAFNTGPDFENPGSADNSNVYVVVVTATAGGQAVTQVVTVTVTNVDDNAPVFAASTATYSVAEGQTVVATVIATDGDGDTITYTLTGADQDDFEISDTGDLRFNTAPDFENPSDADGNNVYVVVVTATAGGQAVTQAVTVTVTNENAPVFAAGTATYSVAEGQTVVTTVIATDDDGDTITYELTSGADQGDFEITDTGELAFNTAPDFENPSDADGNNVYVVVVTATAGGETASQTVTVTVTNENAPVFAAGTATYSVAEGQTAVATVIAIDGDGDTITYELTSGADRSSFTINADTGELAFNTAPDFENPTDAGGNNVYVVVVTATAGGGEIASQTVTVTVTNVNDNSPVLAGTAAHNVVEGQTVVTTVIAIDGDGDTITYELTSGADRSSFTINADTGELAFNTAPDFENPTDIDAAAGELTFNTAPDFENPSDAGGNNVYVVVVAATAGGQAVTQVVTVTVTNVDDNAPVFAAGSAAHNVAEGQTVVATVIATDGDGDTITYTLTGADQDDFEITDTGLLAFNTAPDFENPSDAGGNNVYVVVVTATAGTRTAFQTVTVTVTNVDDNSPVLAGTAAHNVAEGQTAVATVIATDGDGDTITYELTSGADQGGFEITDTGELAFNTAPDFENPGSADNSNVYVVVVTATAGGQAVTQVVTVTVTNVDDNAPVFAASTATYSVAEGQTVVATVIATDGDGDTITYTLTGADQDDFEITDTGELAFNTAPDFENPTDAGGNNVYVVVVTATAGTRTAFQTVTVTVTNVNDNAPVFAAGTAAHNVAEGQTVVATVIATDGDGDTITYTLTGGADQDDFAIGAASGELAFNTAPDFENPGDAGGNNVYVVVVTATAGGQAVTQAVTVTVTNVDDNAPVLAGSAAHSVAEGQTVVATVIAIDGDGDTITYTLTGGADRSSFTIDAASGVLAFNTAPDFENPGSADNSNVYVVVVTATAGGQAVTQVVTVTVTNVDDNAPVFAEGSAAHNVVEGQTVVATVIATDGDGDTITYTLTGVDQGDFEIGADTGELAFRTAPDFENPGSADNSNVYVVVVTATAGGQAVTQVVTVTVTNVDDNAPVFAEGSAAHNVVEGQTVVATVIATDGDGDTITYTLTGVDQDDFEITDTGDLAFNTAPDFENPTDAGGNNVYVVVVAATAGTRTAFQTVTVTVTNVNDNTPVFASTAAHNVAEGQTVVATVIATDGDGDTITYELTSGADRSSFTIDAASGVLAFNTAPDFENPGSADNSNVYVVVVTATAGGQAVTQAVTVTVTNVDDNAPVFAAATAAHAVAEGQTAVTTVTASDGDGDTITYTLTGVDQDDFEITDTGELRFNTAPDFENPTDAGGNNVYVVVVAATAGTRTAFQTVTVTVTNVDDNAPVLVGSAAHNVAEGQTVVATVIATDGDGDTITYTLTGADQDDFEITDTGELAFNTAPDFENPGSADNSNVYVVVVTATAGGQAVTQAVTVTVTNVDDNAPVFAASTAAHNVVEGQTVVTTVTATDGDGDTITYTLTGADQDDFEITDTGDLAFNTAPDFENPTDAGGNNVYVVVVTATAGTRTAFQTVTVTVTNVNDNTPVLASTAAHNVAEGQTVVATVIATDGDGDTITYELTGGADRSSFTIDAASGVLAFNTAPDFENPGSADNSNVYVVVVTATGGGQAVTQVVTVTVTNVDDNAPVLASTAAHTVAEGQTVVGTVIATDGDGDTITYTLTGVDQDDFEITDTGVLAFNTAPDFENPSDAGGNNVYVVVVAATAGTRTAFQTVTVTVTNVDDNAPVFAAGSAAHNVAEGQTAVATVIATDGDGDTITYTLTGADQDDFEITDTGVLAFNTAPDFENPTDADGNNVYVVVVTATAGGEIASQTVTVTVTNVDDNAPVFAASTAAHNVAEGQTAVATVIATDGDGDTITYTLTGADQDDFEITDTGDLRFNTAPDFENPTDAGGNNVYVVVVTATAGTRTAFQTVTVTVTNVDDNAPVFAASTAAHNVAEGQTAVTTVIATDGDGDTITYTLTGADQDDFEITASGVLAFNTAPDFENPGSADNSNVYVVVVTATAGGQAVTQAVTVTVTNVDDNAPVFAASTAAHNVVEGQTVVTTVTATDGDGDTITYTLTGADQDDFEITASGVLAFNTAPDFENPGSADNSNVYVVVVAATAGTRTAFQTVTVTVTNVDDNAPVFAAGSAAHNVAEGQTAVATVIAIDGDGDTITYELTSGADRSSFTIDADTGELTFNTAPDFENPGSADNSNVYVVVVTATAGGETASQTVTVTVTNKNAPVFAAATATYSVAEGQTAVTTVIATDDDGDTITYELTSGADQGGFEIDADTGVLAFRTAPDFENPTDAGGNNVYVVVVTATAGTRTAFQTVTVTVTNVNALVLAGSAAHSVVEGQTAVTTVIATDDDGDTITYELTSGADQGDFEIDADTGVLAFRTAPDFENPTDAGGNNVYVVVVTATAGGQAVTQAVTVTVTNVDDNAPVFAAGTAAHTVSEGQTVVATVIATDGDGDTITYELTSGADRSSFTIDADTGELAFRTAPDFENPGSADNSNVYVVVVTATAGGEIASQTVTVTVTNKNAPVFAAATATYSVAEGQTAVTTVIATDDDGDTITYELTGGADRSSFTIDAASGVLAFNTAPDFENPGSADNSNVYVVVVTATGGGQAVTQVVTVTVTNVDDNAPVLASTAAHNVAEGQTVVGTVIATDGDGDTITYTLTGVDQDDFEITDTGVLAFNTAPDFENPSDAGGNNVYVVVVAATAGTRTAFQTVTVTVTNVNDNAPVFAAGSAAHTVAEGQTAVATVIATDGDGDTITYTLTGADQDDFEITDTGVLAFNTAPDFENPTDADGNNVYVVVVTATAGGEIASQTVTVTVTNVDDNAPVFAASTAAHNVAEGQTAVATVIATDGDGDTITYTLTGADQDDFEITDTGDLRFNTAPDFENPTDAGGNNVYVVVVTATAGTRTAFQTVTVTVTNVNDNAPVFAAGSAAHNVAEGQTAVATVIATDGDGDTITYTLTGADQDDFEITASGELAFNTAPDFENPGSADNSNVYVVVVTATAGGQAVTQTVTVTVTNVDDNAPVFAASTATNSVAEGQTVVATVIATDGDGDTITYTLTGADQDDFEITDTGLLAFNTAPDFENPTDAGGNNVYVVVVAATSGTRTAFQTVTVTVTNVNDNTPVLAGSAAHNVAEGQTVVATVIATDGDGDTITYTLTGADQDDFEITASGELAFNTAPDFENPGSADNSNVYVVVVTATAGGQAVTQVVTVTVTNVDDNAPVFAEGSAAHNVAEGQTVVATVIATDGDGDTITYTLTGADQDDFEITDTGELAFNTAPDFENPTDAGGNNVYVVVVTATAGTRTAFQTVTVTVTNVNENAPVLAGTAAHNVAEGQTVVTTVIATDGDGDTITYELTGGADRSSFTIDAASGVLAFNTAPDFENPGDAGGNNVYVVVVTATAGTRTAFQTVTVTVTNVNENAPVLAGTAAHNVAEGQTVVTTVIATDGDGDTITYTLTGGADRSSFTIDAASGVLAFNTAPDFENPTDAGGNNVYVVVVTATAGGEIASQTVTVTVTNVDDNAPVFAAGSAAHSVAEGQTVVATVIAIDGDGDTITYTLTGGADRPSFTIDAASGVLAFNTAPDFENPGSADNSNVYVVVVTATAGGQAVTQAVTVTVTNVDDNAPVFAAGSTAHNVVEGQTAVATVTATDGDGDTITYELTGVDQGDFEIGADTGDLAFRTAPDFENPGSADNSNVYVVVVTATAGGQAVTQVVTVTVTNVDDNAPVFAAATAAHAVAEGQTAVTTVTASDGDGDTITYTLTGVDQDDFEITDTGELAFNTAPDFENPTDAGGNNVYVVVVTATAGTRTAFQTVTVTVTNVNDNTPVFASTAAHNVAEGQTAVTTVIATDGDGDTITYELTSGADRSSFTIDAASGVLAFNTAPDFENPGSADNSNVYVVVVTATAGSQAVTQAVTVTVTNVDDNAPVFAAGTAAHNVVEGQTVVATVIATDGDGDTITYTLTGADQDDFEISDTGDLRFNTAPDFENPGDAGGNNVYVVVVAATAGTRTAFQTVTVTVTNVDDNAPVFAAGTAAHTVAEGQTAVATVIATDGDGATITYTLTGVDQGDFEIDAASGVLAFNTAPDFENPTDAGGNNVYVVVVTATAGGQAVTQTVTVTVTNVDDNAPVFAASTATNSVAEGQTVVATVIATDGDGDTITYTLTGADQDDFEIDAASGVLAFNTAPDFENPGDAGGSNVYVVVVTATAGTRTAFQTVTVTVTNVNDNTPVLASTATHNVAEGQTVVTTVIATDGDGDTITYTLTGGADQGGFEIDADTGVLAFRTAPDFENPTDAGGNNVYVVVVTATAGGQAVTQAVRVTVTNVDDNAPVFAEGSAAHNVAEGQTAVATVIATDGDGDTITYTLTGADQDDFEITDTGELAFNTAPDFENPSDAGGNNVYVVVVAATSGTRTAFQTVTVTVTNVNDNTPVLASSAAHTVAEGQTAVTTVIATDGDGDTITYTLTGGADQGDFEIDADTGDLAFNTAPDFENPGSADNSNIYVLEVTATAGGQAVTQAVTVTVTNVDDNAPVFAAATAAHTVAKGQTATQTITIDVADLRELEPACIEEANSDHGFTDVPRTSYAYSDVGCIKDLGVTQGTSPTTYSPQQTVTREQMAAFLARLYRTVTGNKCGSTNHGYSDVPRTSYAYSDVGCIKDLGVTQGTSPTTYSPQQTVTREQMAAFLARLYRTVTGNKCGSTNHGYSDVPRTSYVYSDVGCIKDLGVTQGTSPTTYSPQQTVTREQMAAFLARLYRVTF